MTIDWLAKSRTLGCWSKVPNRITIDLVLFRWGLGLGLGGWGVGGKEKKLDLPPNSYVMVQYEPFGLKHYIVFMKKGLRPAKLLFDPSHQNSKFQSCSTIGLWGVYLEILRARAHKSSCFSHIWRKVSKTTFKLLKRLF